MPLCSMSQALALQVMTLMRTIVGGLVHATRAQRPFPSLRLKFDGVSSGP